MWAIIKYDKRKTFFLEQDFKKRLGEGFKFYSPKILIQKYNKNKLIKKEFDILGDYMFCYHKDLNKIGMINILQFSKGLKYFLKGSAQSQKDIIKFIDECKNSENKDGYLSKSFYELYLNCKYRFTSGPFAETIFKIIGLQKNKMSILLGNIRTTINKEEYLFRPL